VIKLERCSIFFEEQSRCLLLHIHAEAADSTFDVGQGSILQNSVSAEKNYTRQISLIEFWTNIHPLTTDTYVHIYLSIVKIRYLGFQGILKPYVNNNKLKFGFIREFWPKRFHKIGPRSSSGYSLLPSKTMLRAKQ
jgi:hypothetical protein